MVYLSFIIALFLVCFALGFMILLFSKTRKVMVFGSFFLIVSGLILVSGSIISIILQLHFRAFNIHQ